MNITHIGRNHLLVSLLQIYLCKCEDTYFVRWNKFLPIYEDTFEQSYLELEMILHMVFTFRIAIFWNTKAHYNALGKEIKNFNKYVYSKNVAKLDAFLWSISSSRNLLFLNSDCIHTITTYIFSCLLPHM